MLRRFIKASLSLFGISIVLSIVVAVFLFGEAGFLIGPVFVIAALLSVFPWYTDFDGQIASSRVVRSFSGFGYSHLQCGSGQAS
ncbi:hypothetical protein OAI26_04975 [Sulfitobacter sp.]|nr:hypothetical protein [Sulfitobacter sp.]